MGQGGDGGEGPPLYRDRVYQAPPILRRGHRLRAAAGVEDESGGGPGRPAGIPEKPAVEQRGGEGKGGEGGGMDGHHTRKGGREEGEVLGFLSHQM